MWRGIAGPQEFQHFPEIACHALDLLLPVKINGELNQVKQEVQQMM